ncbi:uncharacterized protein LOC141651393 [Silene latifolia]|uniref:uncharacterized protein LOC141651393 n=1 Tax=Silene latifolia TaxID=37657 RepID=UPI003D781EB8
MVLQVELKHGVGKFLLGVSSPIVDNSSNYVTRNPNSVTKIVLSNSVQGVDTDNTVLNHVVNSDIPAINPSVTPKSAVNNTVNDKKWSSVLKEQKLGMNLFFCESSVQSTEIEIEESDFEKELKLWEFTLMGNVLGTKPSLKVVQDFVIKNWGSIANPVVQYYRQGWFSFRFYLEEEMTKVLRQGPWKINQNSLILKQWSPSFSGEMDRVAKVPVWILFPGLDPFLWSDVVLSKIVSKIGKPLYADNATTSKEKLSFARVMVEVDVSQDLPECVVLNVPYLGQISQKIIYEWLPYYCKCCGKLGHTSRTCKKNRGSEDSNMVSQQVQTHPIVVPVLARSSQLADLAVSEANSLENNISPAIEPGGTLGSACGKDGTGKRQVDLGIKKVLADDVSLHEDVIILAHDQSKLGGTSNQMLNVVGNDKRNDDSECSLLGQKLPCHASVSSDSGSEMHSGCLAILETRVKVVNASKIAKKLSNWKLICNYEKHYNGRIWLFYNPSTISIFDLRVEAQMISCVAHHHASNQDLQVSLVYGFNAARDRDHLWSALRATRTTLPWIVLGDFNIVRSPEEKLSPNPPVLQDMLDFDSCLSSCCLDDLNSTGIHLTWTNKQDPQFRVWSKLDRALVNPAWLSHFPSSHAVFKEAGLSDHSPVIIYVSDYTRIHKRFSFLNSWISHPAYEETVKNNWYTHKQAERKHQQIIGAIKDSQGLIQQGLDKVETAFQDYYQSLLGTKILVSPLCAALLSSDVMPPADKALLIKDITDQEIKEAVFGIDSNSSPGIDGFSSGFFKSYWHIIGKEYCRVVHSFFKSGKMANQDNSTLITLIPKKHAPSSVLQSVLPTLVGEEQAAFIRGRNIFENIMLSQSLVKGYNRKNISPRCLIKVDIKKAFDSLQWDFIDDMLKIYGFPDQFRKWIMGCITNTWFSLKLNGGISGYFQGQSGVRQGDPLSPYLIVLSMEILSKYLRTVCQGKQVSYHPKCSKLNLTHLIFADDLMIFIRGDCPSVHAIKDVLHNFAQHSSLDANVEKTNIYFGGVAPDVVQSILQDTGYAPGHFPFRYLGIPLHTSRLTNNMYDQLITKVHRAVQHWSSQLLSYAGRSHLINSVIFGLESYWSSFVLLPREGIPDIGRRMLFKSWTTICTPWSAGGFNIKDIQAWNHYLMIKWLWKLSENPEGIWAQWHAAYNLKHQNIWTLGNNNNFSASFNGILAARDKLVTQAGSLQQAKQLLINWTKGQKLYLSQVYGFFRNSSSAGSWTKSLMQSVIVPSHRIICFMIAQNHLATLDNLQRRGFHLANRCYLCGTNEESHLHLFLACSFCSAVWQGLLSWMGICSSGNTLLQELRKVHTICEQKNWKRICFQLSLSLSHAAVHQIWKERNCRIFHNRMGTVQTIISRIQFIVKIRLLRKVKTNTHSIDT